ncbi:leucine-rich repeat flightless-interacting protein 2 isoform X2 [Danaus plexippus]|uniref:leucine-rich repeat flightless-interacting protein 2 isoform X2 n=1 Tax=Danaus plexippus TaxID=13037 RepID=UPI002AB225CC|nr:leucine-rich repeat flightless-interacting protein 2 isoform X2 [Danaus plexippus]
MISAMAESGLATPENSDDESGDAFTDGDFGDSDDEVIADCKTSDGLNSQHVNETVNTGVVEKNCSDVIDIGVEDNMKDISENSGVIDDDDDDLMKDLSSNGSIVGILGDQHNHAEQRLAARRAARAEAREIRMRELERQQREQEDHADKAYDMYNETVGRRAGSRLAALSPSVHSPRRSSEDSEDVLSIKDLRHEMKEVEEKFRKAMILNAQLDNDKAALGYQLELLKDRIEELHEEYAQLQREHREKCSLHERLKREHATLEREVAEARDAVRARDGAAAAAGRVFVDASAAPGVPSGGACGAVPALALVTLENQQLLDDAGEGTLDVRLSRLAESKSCLEGEVRRLKLQLCDERAARQNGVAEHHDRDLDNELESLRKALSEAKGRAARAEAEAALQAAGVARLEAQVVRLRARQEDQDEREEALKQDRRRLQREEVVDFWAVINNGNV